MNIEIFWNEDNNLFDVIISPAEQPLASELQSELTLEEAAQLFGGGN